MFGKKKLPLLAKIAIAMALGVGAGYLFPDWISRIFATFNSIFSEFLGFIIPLLIVGLVAPAITDIGRKAGGMLLFTVVLAYGFTLLSGLTSYFVSDTFFPSLITVDKYLTVENSAGELAPYFTMSIAPLMDVMTALIFAFVLGLGGAFTGSRVLRGVLNDFRSIIEWTIAKAIIPLLPLYIFGIFLSMTVTGQVGPILVTFVKIIAVIFALHIGILVLQYSIAGVFTGKNPFKCLMTMMPAYFTALGTQSSAATIPVTLKQTVKMGVNQDIAGFTIPLCATIHMSGSTLKIVACAMALMILKDMPYDFGMFAGFIAMLGITMVAAPGVPGGAIMAALGILSSMLGFSEADLALIIALYIAMDSFGTACNVTGDGAVSLIVNRFFAKKVVAQPVSAVDSDVTDEPADATPVAVPEICNHPT